MEPASVRMEAAAMAERRERWAARWRAMVAAGQRIVKCARGRAPVWQQYAGGWLLGWGVWLEFGTAIGLMLAGIGLLVVGALREGGRI